MHAPVPVRRLAALYDALSSAPYCAPTLLVSDPEWFFGTSLTSAYFLIALKPARNVHSGPPAL